MATGRLPDPNTAPVTAKGDLYTYSTVPAKLAVGNNGETLVADSSATTGLRWQGNYSAGKNAIINGDFRIWQRGTSFSNPSGGAYNADRFRIGYDGTASTTRTVTREAFTLGTAPVAGYEALYFGRITTTTKGSNTRTGFAQLIESVRSFAGQTITVSFWGKCDTNRSGHINVTQYFGTGGSPSANVEVTNTSISLTSSWQRFSVSVAVPSIAGKTLGTNNDDSLQINLYYNTADGATFDVWGVQVEAGSVATAFQTATGTLAGEYAAAQRYYQKSYNAGTAVPTNTTFIGAVYGNATSTANNACYTGVRFPVNMRIAPTITMYSYTTSQTNRISNNAGTDQGASSAVASGIGESGFGVYNNSGGTITTTDGFIVHYAASAEL